MDFVSTLLVYFKLLSKTNETEKLGKSEFFIGMLTSQNQYRFDTMKLVF